LLEISDDGRNDWMQRRGNDERGGWELNGEHIQRSRVRIDTRKWLLSKMLPKVYGDKSEVAGTGPNGGPCGPTAGHPAGRDCGERSRISIRKLGIRSGIANRG
jgi:hypothetical protein